MGKDRESGAGILRRARGFMAGGPSTGPELNEVAWIESRYGGGGPSPSPQAQWLFEQI